MDILKKEVSLKANKDISNCTHSHQFNQEKKTSETKTLIVIIVTFAAMVIEIFAGWYFGSMALFSDGWHMMTHATALSISFFAYVFARKMATDKHFVFGTWKIEILGAYTSAIVLGFVGFFILGVSINRIYHPVDISYNQALLVTCFGLIVNVICVLVLQDHDHHHTHDHHTHEHDHTHHHSTKQDLNLKSAYLHVLADALTSVLAIIALLGAKYYEWIFLDPLMGIVGAVLIFRWTILLIRESASILTGRESNEKLVQQIYKLIETDGDTQITDIHIWRIAQDNYACIICLVASKPISVSAYKSKLNSIHELDHVTIEVNQYSESEVT